jgi:uncharacterized integral membrane protein (TIGR00698 family)
MVAMSATLVSTLFGGPQLLYALFFGVALHYLSAADKVKEGIDFCSRHVLRLGVGLLGVRITADQIIGLGWITAAIVVGAVVTTLLLGYAMAKRLGLSRAEGTLSGGAVAICGASAALAIAAVLPRSKDSERFTLMVVVTVTVFSTIAMVLYPFIARAWGLSPELAGLFLGGTIHDVAQVVGAGYTLDTATGDYATIVKLLRVSMLAVLVIAVSCFFKVERERAAQEWEAASGSGFVSQQPLVPWFLWVFLLLVFVNSAGWLSSESTQTLRVISRVCLVVAIAALGLKTSLEQLSKAGWQPVTLILIETVWIAAFVLVAIALTQFA